MKIKEIAQEAIESDGHINPWATKKLAEAYLKLCDTLKEAVDLHNLNERAAALRTIAQEALKELKDES